MKKVFQLSILTIALLSTQAIQAETLPKLYQHCDYGGYSALLEPGAYKMKDMKKIGLRNDDLSSISLPSGYVAILYQHDHFKGKSWTFTSSDSCFVDNGLNDIASSVIIAKRTRPNNDNMVTVYQHCDFGGYSVKLKTGPYSLTDLKHLGIKNDDLSAIKVPEGYEVTLYEHDFFSGRSTTLTHDNSCLVNNGFNDVVSSILVRCTSCN